MENVPCTLEKKVYSASVGWNVLCMSLRSIGLKQRWEMSALGPYKALEIILALSRFHLPEVTTYEFL